ncbi:MAG TPA: hypothetical protein VFZ65_02725 [Planctomycetota bacterium]|nr:hypothetical protein [Planctomycetota bacterium]
MHRLPAVLSLATWTLLCADPAPARPAPPPSDPTGVFALLDKVVLLPDDQHPTEVELHGVFAVAAGPLGDYYRAPRRGVVRFAAGKKPDDAVQQWRELAKHAGKGTVLGFSSRWELNAEQALPVRVLGPGEAAGALPVYGTGFGLHEVQGVEYGPVRELLLLPRCADVAFEAARDLRWPARRCTFTCENCLAKDADLAYVFAVDVDGERFASKPIPAGAGTTTWSTELVVQPGQTVSWSVHVAGGKVARAPVASASEVVPESPAAGR